MKKIITANDIQKASKAERVRMLLAIIKGQAIYLDL